MKERENKTACVISGGKDGILAYYKFKKRGYNLVSLVNFFSNNGKVSFHSYQRELVKLQSIAMNVPLIQKRLIEQKQNQKLFEKEIYDFF